MTTYQKADKNLYSKYTKELQTLYLETFTNGISAQHISQKDAETYLDSTFKNGFGIFVFSNNNLIASLLATPISYDDERPDEIIRIFNDEDSLYIAEVLVSKNYRGQGIGNKIIQYFENHLDPNIKNIFLRVWQENKVAVNLYKKSGFTICGEISQEKYKPETKEKFIMHKNYMVKSI